MKAFVALLWSRESLSDFKVGCDIIENMHETDLQLLTRYSRECAEDAFAEIVRRYIDLVYSTALRQVRSPELAEDVSQMVFIELARQASRLPSGTVMAAWLYQVARRRAIDAVRREAGRRQREQTAQQLQAMSQPAEDWKEIEPLLDDAMDSLEEPDRLAILLRYFGNKPLREIGQVLGVGEDAAQKRVSRAVERLRKFLSEHGVGVSATGLVLSISTNAVQAAPSGLSATISTAAFAETSFGVALTTTTKAITMTTVQKTFIGAALLVIVGGGLYEAQQGSKVRRQNVKLQEQQAVLAAKITQLSTERDELFSQLAVVRQENDKLNRNANELFKARNELTQLRRDLRTANDRNAGVSAPATQAALDWAARVTTLRDIFDQRPDEKIPQLQTLSDEDWLSVAKQKFDSEIEVQERLGLLRDRARKNVLGEILAALQRYKKENAGALPGQIDQLKPFFTREPVDALLSQYELHAGQNTEQWEIVEKRFLDGGFDSNYRITGDGSFAATQGALTEARQEFFLATDEKEELKSAAQLLPYANTPEAQEIIRHLLLGERGQ